MASFKVFSLLSFLVGFPALAQTIEIGADATIAELNAKEYSVQGVQCHYVKDIPGTITCLTENGDLLRDLMGRVSMYVEGAPSKSLVAEKDKKYLASSQANYAGHDIQSQDMEEFFLASEKSCVKKKSHCLNSLETQLRDRVLTVAKERGYKHYVVLAAAGYTGYLKNVMSHEYLHARFFLNEKYRAKVKEFWTKNLDQETRKAIRESLGETYNLKGKNGEFLLLNEFQAYVLEDEAMYGNLGRIAMYHGSALQEHLSEFLTTTAPGEQKGN